MPTIRLRTVVLLTVALCTSACSIWEAICKRDDPISVDRSLARDAPTLPPFAPGTPERTIGVVVGPTGDRYQLVEEELLVAASDDDEIEGLLSRLGGRSLGSWSFDADGDASGLTYHAVRIDGVPVAHDDLDRALADMDSAAGGIRVSSEAVLRTFAAYASESKRGIHLIPNFVLESDALPDRTTTEASDAIGAFAGQFSRNAFEWPYMRLGGPLDIGVAEAWRALDATGRLGERVPVLILDAGFRPTPDLPPDTVLVGGTRWNVPNPYRCVTGPCPWHGTGTARVVSALVDDGFGGAGIAGPVAQLHLLQSPVPNLFDYLRYLGDLSTVLPQPRIVNLSGSTTVDQWVCDVSGLFLGPAGACFAPHALGASLRSAGFLVVSSAGNDSRDVDRRGFTIPCELRGTVCVSGLDWNRPAPVRQSNFGSRRDRGAIDLWAPWHVWVGPDPAGDLTRNEASLFTGTSAASPFVAGVAALVAAADPTLSADRIAEILVSTAHPGGPGRVHRWVNAYGAVSEALHGRVPPFVRILQPVDGDVGPRMPDVPTRLQATVESPAEDPVVTWASSIDGPLGRGLATSALLSYGTHVLTATTEANGLSYSASVSIEKTDLPPRVEIVDPPAGARFFAHEGVHLLGSSFDVNEPDGTLAETQVSWRAGARSFGTGAESEIPEHTLSPGSYTLTFTGDDGTHRVHAERGIEILPDPENLPPRILSIEPASGTDLGWAELVTSDGSYVEVTLTANATDPDGPPLTDPAFTWTTEYTHPDTGEVVTAVLGTGRTLRTRLVGLCPVVRHRVTLTVVNGPPCGPAVPRCNESSRSALYDVKLFC